MVFRTGDRVEHLQRPKWGSGIVKQILENGRIRVWFIHVGEKVLVLDKANLVPLRGVLNGSLSVLSHGPVRG